MADEDDGLTTEGAELALSNSASPNVESDIQAAVAAAFASRAFAGQPRVERGVIQVTLAGRVRARAPLGLLLKQWDVLPEDVRAQRAQALAAQLLATCSESRAATPESVAWLSQLGFGVLALTLILGIAYRFLWPRTASSSNEPAEVAPPNVATSAQDAVAANLSASSAQRSAPALRAACERTRERVLRGGTLVATDSDGWVVELRLLRTLPVAAADVAKTSGPTKTAATRGAAQGAVASWAVDALLTGRAEAAAQGFQLRWPEAPELSQLNDPDSFLRLDSSELSVAGSGTRQELRWVFNGVYAASYFTEGERMSWLHLAARLASDLGASQGALFARCEHLASHHAAAWIFAPSVPGAAAMLLYAVGLFGATPQLAAQIPGQGTSGAAAPERARALLELERATVGIERKALVALLGPHQGALGGRDNVTLTFPFKDGNRAALASRDLARSLGLGRP